MNKINEQAHYYDSTANEQDGIDFLPLPLNIKVLTWSMQQNACFEFSLKPLVQVQMQNLSFNTRHRKYRLNGEKWQTYMQLKSILYQVANYFF